MEDAPPKKAKAKFPTVPVLIALVLAVVASVSVWWFVIRTPKGQDTGGPANSDGTRLTVSKHAGVGQFSKIRDAISKATPGSHIVLMDEEWEESLIISSAPPKGLVIEPAEGKQVTWKPEKGKEPTLLISISRAENLVVRRIRFQGEGSFTPA